MKTREPETEVINEPRTSSGPGTPGRPPPLRVRSRHRKRMSRHVPKKDLQTRVLEHVGLILRDSSYWAEAFGLLVLATLATVVVIATGLDAHWVPNLVMATVLGWVAVAVVVASPPLRAYVVRSHRRGQDRLLFDKHVTRHFDHVWNQGLKGTKNGEGPQLVAGTEALGPADPELPLPPGVDYHPPCIIPGPRRSFIKFDVIPQGCTASPEEICQHYAAVAGYSFGVPAEGTTDQVIKVLLSRDPAPEPWPVPTSELHAWWPQLLTSLDAVYCELEGFAVHGVTSESTSPYLADSVEVIDLLVRYEVADDSETNHEDLVRKLVLGLRCEGYDASYDVVAGLRVILYPHGKPSPVPIHPSKLNAETWPAVAEAIGFPADKIPAFASFTFEGLGPPALLPPGLVRRESFFDPTPEVWRLQVHQTPGSLPRPHIRNLLANAAGCESVELVWSSSAAGTVVAGHRDALPLGAEFVREFDPNDTKIILGKTFQGDMVYNFGSHANAGIAGVNGAGKGVALGQIARGFVGRGATVFMVNPKGHSEIAKLMRGMVEVPGDLAQVAALMTLARLEVLLRAWKMKQASEGLWTDGEVRSLETAADYVALQDRFNLPPIGGHFAVMIDEAADLYPVTLDKTDDDRGALRKQLRANTREFAAKDRFVWGHLIMATQNAYVAAFGGGEIKGNLNWQLLLRVIDFRSAKLLMEGLTDEEMSRLVEGPGKGHNFHTGPQGRTEGQVNYFQSPDDLADVVPGYLAAHPYHQQHRDFVAELKRTQLVVLGDDPANPFSSIALARFPYLLGPRPVTDVPLTDLETRRVAQDEQQSLDLGPDDVPDIREFLAAADDAAGWPAEEPQPLGRSHERAEAPEDWDWNNG